MAPKGCDSQDGARQPRSRTDLAAAWRATIFHEPKIALEVACGPCGPGGPVATSTQMRQRAHMSGEPRSIGEVLAAARARLTRMSPQSAAAAALCGAILVDIRPSAQRAEEGEIPGAVVIERNVLEWRLDPSSDARIPAAVDHDVDVIVFCSEGYTSSLAALSLQHLGLHRATDIEGGFRAWARAGLPVAAPQEGARHLFRGERPFASTPAVGTEPLVLDPERALLVEAVREVADGRLVELSSQALSRVRAARTVVEQSLQSGVAAYGLNAGLGHARDESVSARQLSDVQVGIVLSHASGVGPPLPAAQVRAAMLARLNSAVRGGSALRELTTVMLAQMLNSRIHPVVPAIGSVGASDLMHLAAVASVAIGHGEAELDGTVMSGAEALAAAGLVPLTLEAGEGLALVSANSVSTGGASLAVGWAQQLMEGADIVAALSLEAIDANLSVIDPAVGEAKPVAGQQEVIAHLRSLLAGSRLFEPGRAGSLQDPLSFRVVPQVHGAVRELVRAARNAVEIELNAMDDNPLVSISQRRLISNGNFHPMAMALSFDALRPGLAHVGLCSIRRMNHLDKALFGEARSFEEAMVAAAHGERSGLSSYAAAALWAELRQLAGPATLDIQSLDLEQEDHATAAPLSVSATEHALSLLEQILAIELDCASCLLGRRPSPAVLGSGTEAAFALATKAVGAHARSAARVNDTMAELLRSGALQRAAREAPPR